MADAARQLEAAGGWRVRRQRFSVERKRLIVEATLQPGASVAQVARAHEINANQVFKWKRLYEQGLLVSRPSPDTKLLAVHVAEEPSSELACMPAAAAVGTGAIHVEIPARALVTIEASADPRLLRVVLESLFR
jgi:transposase